MKLIILKTTILKAIFLSIVIIQVSGCSKDNNVVVPKVLEIIYPNAPTDLSRALQSSSSDEASLYWKDNSDNETGFRVERKSNSGSFEVIKTLNSDVTSYNISGLGVNTTYTYRVCSYNNIGNSKTYSNEFIIITDIDGNPYTQIKIGNQIWMKENYSASKYRNGDIIAKMGNGQIVVTPKGAFQWSNLTDIQFGAYVSRYDGFEYPMGKFYNWYAVNDSRGLAPLGWHVPTRAEWKVLSDFLGGELVAGGKMKETTASWINSNNGGESWTQPNAGASNVSGFRALPGGFLKFEGTRYGSTFDQSRFLAYFWTSSEFDLASAYTYKLFNYNESLLVSSEYKVQGGNVRLIKD